MQVKIIFVDDVNFALQHLHGCVGAACEHWVLVACAPKITRRASRWGNRSTLQRWRGKWAKDVFEGLMAHSTQLQQARVSTYIAEFSVQQMAEQLRVEYPQAQVLDWRRPKPVSEPPAANGASSPSSRGALLGVLGLCCAWTLD